MQFTSFLQDGKLTVALTGEIDHHRAGALMQELETQLDLESPRSVELDLGGVSFMDSSGIAVVISAMRHMREIGGKLTLRDVPAQPMKVLRASGIEKIVQIEERSLEYEM